MRYHHLLSLRSRDWLERMSNVDRRGLLQDLVRLPPSESVWRAVFELFTGWPDGDEKDEALAVAEGALAPWDDRLRSADTASRDLFKGRSLASAARLVRSINIYRRGEAADDELQSVVTSSEAAHLTRLVIVRAEVTSGTWKALVTSDHLGRVQHLHVTNVVIRRQDVADLLGSVALPSLCCLQLTDVGLRPDWVLPIRESLPFRHLRQIDFSRNLLSDEGAVTLAQAPWLEHVERLALRHNFISRAGMEALMTSPRAQRLRRLDLSDNDITVPERAELRRIAGERGLELAI